jgi:predicted MFS family arabinose efflux permease
MMWGMAGVSAATALGLYLMVRDPAKIESEERGSLFDLLRMPALWLIFPLVFFHYAPAAGIRGLWIGPFFADVFAAGPAMVGNATLVMGVAMIAGTFVYGPLDRVLGTRKWVILAGTVLNLACIAVLALAPPAGMWGALALFAGVGFFGASYPVLMAHGRSFYPPHLVGRGVTLMNLFAIGGVGVMQVATGRVFALAQEAGGGGPEAGYRVLFGFFAVTLVAGLVLYLFAEDRVG